MPSSAVFSIHHTSSHHRQWRPLPLLSASTSDRMPVMSLQALSVNLARVQNNGSVTVVVVVVAAALAIFVVAVLLCTFQNGLSDLSLRLFHGTESSYRKRNVLLIVELDRALKSLHARLREPASNHCFNDHRVQNHRFKGCQKPNFACDRSKKKYGQTIVAQNKQTL